MQAFIIASGPSLRGFGYAKLKGRHCIAVNLAFRSVLWAEHVYFSDCRFWRWHHEELRRHPGRLHTVCRLGKLLPSVYQEDSVTVWERGRAPLDPVNLSTGNSSGYAAISLAVRLGFRRLVLLGYDYAPAADGAMHCHEEHPIAVRDGALDKMRTPFPALAAALVEEGVEVINANPDSALDCFSVADLDEILSDIGR